MVTFSLDDNDDDDDIITNNDDYQQQHNNEKTNTKSNRFHSFIKPLRIDTLDDYDIQRTFEAMDEHKFGTLRPIVAYQILLGLGFLGRNHYTDCNKFTYQDFLQQIQVWNNDLHHQQQRNGMDVATPTATKSMIINDDNGDDYEGEIVTLEMLLDIVRRNSNVLKRNRSENLNHMFHLVDRENKGYVTADDIQMLAKDVKQQQQQSSSKSKSSLSIDEARAMVQLTKGDNIRFHIDAPNNGDSSTTSSKQSRITSNDFRSFMSPPSP